MTVRVTLVSAAMSTALREARFDDGGPLEPAGLRQAEQAAGALPAGGRSYASPSPRCAATATALGLRAEPAPALAGCAMGRWTGLTLAEVAAAEGEAVARWLGDPAAAPHGGESLLDLFARVAGWLDALPADAPSGAERGPVTAVVEPDVVRAAALHALGVPGPAFWRLDVQPLSVTELTGRSGRWNVRWGRPAGG
ncbi:histidine phosphatase family protein [Kitasatospora sp. NBC_00240]|uniref:histidine phosphatase family protein n=1 Tax=Kitasatospora sp. NBC_00240 TaxID=2903567 RepID=UPI00225374D4|nr:histidine phosphatase family protein [Kitasatospora sp. NBC_00240]MCX5209046.1 histidine phosphatase family protein [Kitasatospora sp. NBC_00240]